MSILSGIILGAIIGSICAILRFLYLYFKVQPIVVDLNSPKYKSMKNYDSYEEWKKDWA